MTERLAQIAHDVRELLLAGVLATEDPASLEGSTPLISAGRLDSIRTVTLIGELEARFDVSFEAYEMSVDYLDSIDCISETILRKTQ